MAITVSVKVVGIDYLVKITGMSSLEVGALE